MEEKTRYHFNNIYFDDPLKFGEIRLVQIGRRYCEASAVIAAHPHLNWFELTIATAGSGEIITNDHPHTICAGEIYLSFPCDVHELRASKTEGFEYDFFSFYCEDSELQKELEKIAQNYRSPEKRTFRDDRISNLINYALPEFSACNTHSENILENIFHLIMMFLLRDFSNIPQETSNISDAKILCLQLMNYIDTHIYSIHTLESIGEPFHYSYNHLSSLFRKTTGKKLSEYYQNRKLETAKILLANNKKVMEVSEMLHYSSSFAFTNAFKKRFGISPKQYRASIRK